MVELFQTTGTVQYAEVLWEGGRSKGVGIIQFASQEEAETAIQKFRAFRAPFLGKVLAPTDCTELYNYGGRNLSLEFNGRWRDFTLQPVVRASTPFLLSMMASMSETAQIDHDAIAAQNGGGGERY